ncbi:xanthine phosphoribosyltransferase [bacterium BMS3Bbin02]|nr:xanthine phosphoribosyltransferase [bacterium BMS3Bbin02]
MGATLPSTLTPVNIADIVVAQARVEGNLVKVDDFLNHRIDPTTMRQVGSQIATLLEDVSVDLILTAEASGIPPALATSLITDIPCVYAKKYVGAAQRYAFGREVVSPTKGVEYRVEVARRQLRPGLRIVVVDDFLSGGRTAEALGEIVEEAGCEVVKFIFVIEKTFTGGRSRLEARSWDVEALVKIADISNGAITLA